MLRAAHQHQPLLREIGLDAEAIFTDPRIIVWRDITERQNCTLDATLSTGQSVRMHIKRYHPTRENPSPAEVEARAIDLLESAGIPSTPVVAWGTLPDRRCFLITLDLAPLRPADKLLADPSFDFAPLLQPTADLAARLHNAQLHHRDLYLCHFFANPADPGVGLHLIDAARVARLRNPLTRRRWIVKDLAQFWYSTLAHPQITDAHRHQWLARYAQQRDLPSPASLLNSIKRKSNQIARHDANLKSRQPKRNVSIPSN